MHIAINTIPLSGGHSGRGIGIYTKELISALQSHERTHQYSFFAASGDIDRGADVVHYPFFDPFFLTLPKQVAKPTVVTVHDLIQIVHASHFPRGIRGEIKWQIQKHRLGQVANSIITDSQTSRKDIIRLINVPSDRIEVIPLAPRSSIHRIIDKKTLSEVSNKYKLSSKYVLYVGDVNWNKNVPGIIQSFHQINQKHNNLMLVLVGKAFIDGSLVEIVDIRRQIDTLGLKNHVMTPGFIPDEDLSCLYSQADALLFPSYAEGFGFPVLEAMVCGCPVVSSSISSLGEIAGPSILVNPDKTEDILSGLDMVLSMSQAKRRGLVEEGLLWAGKFSWKKVAQETVKMYEKTISYYSGI